MKRYMRKPYRCNVCFHSFDTFDQARDHWFGTHASNEDYCPCGGVWTQYDRCNKCGRRRA